MHPGDSDSAHRATDRDTRLRLLSLNTPIGEIHFGGALACVLTDTDVRAAVATGISRAVIGPRVHDIDGALDIAGRVVALQSLPAPLLAPSEPVVVDSAATAKMWQDLCRARRGEIESAHAARRLDRHRIDAAIERARERLHTPEAEVVELPAPTVEEHAEDEALRQLEDALCALEALPPVPSSEALALAASFEELWAQPDPEPLPDADAPDIDVLAVRVEEARNAVAQIAGGVLPMARERIERSHRAVVDAERQLFDAGKKEKPQALATYQDALSAERDALAEAGVDSYAAFLVAIAGGNGPVDIEARLRAELDLAQAEAELERARAGSPAQFDERAEKELVLRARAAQVLGRFPGADPVAELRALTVENPSAEDIREELRRQLVSIDVPSNGDPVAASRALLEASRSRTTPAPVVATHPSLSASSPTAAAELQALLEERTQHDDALAALEAELEFVDGQRARTFEDLDTPAITFTLDRLLDDYRAGQLMAGRLPLVFDGIFDQLSAPVGSAIARHLSAVQDVQVILVTAQPHIVDSFAGVGAVTLQWPDLDSADAVPSTVEFESENNVRFLRRRGA
jgi:hypothetical protein